MSTAEEYATKGPSHGGPNFFIVGAPKCGTTALSEYLRQHPNVFMSVPKEPHYFAYDLPSRRNATSFEEYSMLFASVQERHEAIGEASVYYLYSSVAIPEISRRYPDARLIVMVRSPVDMVYSLYTQFRYTADENAPNFETAWRLQELRREGERLPPGNFDRVLLQYGDIGRLGRQIERALRFFPKDKVKIVIYDDFVNDPDGVYRDVLSFLCVSPDNRREFPRINEGREHRSNLVGTFIMHPPSIGLKAAKMIKQLTGIRRLNILPTLQRWNTKIVKRESLRRAFRRELVDYFRDDIMMLSKMVDRDLSHWCES